MTLSANESVFLFIKSYGRQLLYEVSSIALSFEAYRSRFSFIKY